MSGICITFTGSVQNCEIYDGSEHFLGIKTLEIVKGRCNAEASKILTGPTLLKFMYISMIFGFSPCVKSFVNVNVSWFEAFKYLLIIAVSH
jgi:hypothetical protein